MALRKCPRCELNYILDGGDLCTVCYEDVHGKSKQEDRTFLCSVCGEAPALAGEDMCQECLNELKASMDIISTDSDDDDGDAMDVSSLDDEPVSDMDEIDAIDDIVDNDDDDIEIEEDDEDLILQDMQGA